MDRRAQCSVAQRASSSSLPSKLTSVHLTDRAPEGRVSTPVCVHTAIALSAWGVSWVWTATATAPLFLLLQRFNSRILSLKLLSLSVYVAGPDD